MNHYCEKYSCSISLEACKSRQTIAKDMRHPSSSDFRYAGCGICDLTKITTHKNAIQMEPKEVIMSSEIDQKKCCRCHELKAFDRFCKNISNKDKMDYICKECKYADAIKRRERIRMEKINTDSSTEKTSGHDPVNNVDEEDAIPDVMLEVVEAKMNIEKEGSNDRKRIDVDFSEYPELYDYFIDKCRDDFRTPNMMIMYLISSFQKQ